MDEQREKEFQDLQVLIYKELPELIHKIAHAAFMNCEKGSRVIFKEDMKFISPFLEETKTVFDISFNSETAAIEQMLLMHETKEHPIKMHVKNNSEEAAEKVAEILADKLRNTAMKTSI